MGESEDDDGLLVFAINDGERETCDDDSARALRSRRAGARKRGGSSRSRLDRGSEASAQSGLFVFVPGDFFEELGNSRRAGATKRTPFTG
jgi:hypothetical protein